MKNFLKNFSFMGVIMFALCVILGVGDVSGAICADAVATDLNPDGTGKSVTTPAKDGGLTYSDLKDKKYGVPDLIDDPVDQNLVKIRPYANPIDTLLRYFGAENVNNLEWGYYQIGTRKLEDKVGTGGATITSNANKQNVKGLVPVTNPALFDETDTVFVPSINGADGAPLMLYVYGKDANDKLMVTIAEEQMLDATTHAAPTSATTSWEIPAIAANTVIYAGGRAAGQKDVTSPTLSFLPNKKTGYCQIFMCQIEESTYAKIADKEIKFDLSEAEEQLLFDYRRRQEGTWLYGRMSKVWNPIKKEYIYTSGGLVNGITKAFTLHAGATDGNAQIVALHKYVFKGNNGARTRFAICGSDAMERISKLQGIERKQEATNTEVVFGITWSKMVTNFGQINMVLHEQLDEYGMSDKMIIVDPAFLKMKRVHGFERQQVNGKEHLITNGDIVVYSEACGLAVYNPDVHCIVTVATSAS